MNTNVLYAVFKRNFLSYFASPTGYVFICVFVWLSVFAAFWVPAFFSANLANLDQLNWCFPLIMLAFVPAITMSVWAEERRLGTDELVLTIPAGDLDIVLGKYLAAVSIYSVSLVFSLVCTYAVLRMLGNPDGGLLLGTYFGYWLVGLTMLAVGMVASFLTGNLTVAYILGVIFNLPLVCAFPGVLTVVLCALIGIPRSIIAIPDAILLALNENWTLLSDLHGRLDAAVLEIPPRLSVQLAAWGTGGQFEAFGHGVISLSGIAYFVMLAVAMLYLSMVLIGRRHWGTECPWLSRLIGHLMAPILATFLAFFSAVLLHFAVVLLSGGTSISWPVWAPGLAILVGLGALGVSLARGWDRPWFSGISLPAVTLHYAVRTCALFAVAGGVIIFFNQYDFRLDVSSGQLNSLSPQTVKILRDLEVEQPVRIEAFISPESEIPESYVQTRLNLLNRLREMKAYGGEKIKLIVDPPTERLSEKAARADQRFGITPREVRTSERGTLKSEPVFMGVAVSCGLKKVVIPFIDRGIPIEYELVRSIATVTQQKRKTVGVLGTDANLQGGYGSPDWPIIGELKKQYNVDQVSASDLKNYDYLDRREKRIPLEKQAEEIEKELESLDADEKDKAGELRKELKEIEKKLDGELKIYDVLLAVQPSSLGPEQMNDFVAAIQTGQPTAIFEDPCPMFAPWVPATTAPKPPPRGMNPMMAMQQRPQPKGDIGRLWDVLGIDFDASKVVWQDYNPYPKIDLFSKQKAFVFIGKGSDAAEPFNNDAEISSGLQNALFPFPGAMSKLNSSDLEFTNLVETGDKTGTVRYGELVRRNPMNGQVMGLNPDARRRPTKKNYVLAAQIKGKVKPDRPMADEQDEAPDEEAGQKKATDPEVNVVVVADIDMLTNTFFSLREQGQIEELGISFDFDNVTFVLNILDELAGDNRFIDIRKRRAEHRTLVGIDKSTKDAREKMAKTREKLYKEYEKAEKELGQALEDKIAELKQRKNIDALQAIQEIGMVQEAEERKLQARLREKKAERDKEMLRIETELAQEKRHVQDNYKMWAVLLPPIFPLMVGLVVWLIRRAGEREGVSRARLKP